MASPADTILGFARLRESRKQQQDRIKAQQHAQMLSTLQAFGQQGLRMRQQSKLQAQGQEFSGAQADEQRAFTAAENVHNRRQQSGLQEALLGFKGTQADKDRGLAQQRIDLLGENNASLIESRRKELELGRDRLDQAGNIARDRMAQDLGMFEKNLGARASEIDKRINAQKQMAKLKILADTRGDQAAYGREIELLDKRFAEESRIRKNIEGAKIVAASLSGGGGGSIGPGAMTAMLNGIVEAMTSNRGAPAQFIQQDPDLQTTLKDLFGLFASGVTKELEQGGKSVEAKDLMGALKELQKVWED